MHTNNPIFVEQAKALAAQWADPASPINAACINHLAGLIWLAELPPAITLQPYVGLLCQIGRYDIWQVEESLHTDVCVEGQKQPQRLAAAGLTPATFRELKLKFPDPLRPSEEVHIPL